MLTVNSYLIIAMFIVGTTLVSLGIAIGNKKPYSMSSDIFNVFGILSIIIAILIFCFSFIAFSSGFSDHEIYNNDQTALKIIYVKYHPFTENTIETKILMPDRAIILKNCKILSKTATITF